MLKYERALVLLRTVRELSSESCFYLWFIFTPNLLFVQANMLCDVHRICDFLNKLEFFLNFVGCVRWVIY